MQMNADKRTVGKETLFQKLTLFVICVYAASLYIGYVNSALLGLQGLTLYAMVGLLAIVIIQNGVIRLNSYVIWYGIFLLFALIACLYAPNRSVALNGVYSVLIVLIFSVVLNTVITSRKHIEYIFASLIIGSVILTVYLAVTGKFSEYTDVGSRFGGDLTGNANVFALVYMVAAAASVYFIFKIKNKRKKFILIAAFASQLYALIVSGGRKYFIFPFILMYLMALQKGTKKQRVHIIRVTVVSIISVVVIYQLLLKVEFLYDNIGYRFEDFLNYSINPDADVEGGTIIREKMIKKGIELWKESPLFGHGTDMFSAISGFGIYSHNNFVELLCNHGIVGFVWYYGFYAYVVIKLLKTQGSDNMKRFLVGFTVSLLVYETGAIAYDTLITQIFLVFAAIYPRLSPQEEAETADRKDALTL